MGQLAVFIERRINQADGCIELWACEWENSVGGAARKVDLYKVGDEQPLKPEGAGPVAEAPAICWSYGRTLGNIAVYSPSLIGRFPGGAGNDAELPCDFVNAGKYRNGADRWWCRTHQTHWGTKADQEALTQFGEMRCSNCAQKMHYVVSPKVLNLSEYAEVGIWCSMPAALSTMEIKPRAPKIHVHVRPEAGGGKIIDRDFPAISILYNDELALFGAEEITRVNITPPSAFEFVRSLEAGREMSCINCSHCGYPHLDLGDFAVTPHRKHFCGNCGRDSTWSRGPIVSTPLKPLHDRYARSLKYEEPARELNLDEFQGCPYAVWASTPAVVWTAARPQELGIHVHVENPAGGPRLIDDTFRRVILNRKLLERGALIEAMIGRTIS